MKSPPGYLCAYILCRVLSIRWAAFEISICNARSKSKLISGFSIEAVHEDTVLIRNREKTGLHDEILQ